MAKHAYHSATEAGVCVCVCGIEPASINELNEWAMVN